jgi:hypothetical protein
MTNRFKSALRKAFPAVKFTVERNGEHVTWTDDGPTTDEVRDALLSAGCITEDKRECFEGNFYPADRNYGNVCFYRYNAAKREAEKAEWDRRREEWRALDERKNKAVEEARERSKPPSFAAASDPTPNPEALSKRDAALEQMRLVAEAQVKSRFDMEGADRRPSWAPPLIIEGELLGLCHELGCLALDDKPIARFWATFASPKRAGNYFRENKSAHLLSGLQCRTFTLFSGAQRGNVSQILFEAQRKESGSWRTGPIVCPPSFYRSREWEPAVRDLETIRIEIEKTNEASDGVEVNPRLAAAEAKVARIEAADAERYAEAQRRYEQHKRVTQLAGARVLEFLGAPDAQMQMAARLWGHCCICGRGLTDPISMERGIGPECYDHLTKEVTSVFARTGSFETRRSWSGGRGPGSR